MSDEALPSRRRADRSPTSAPRGRPLPLGEGSLSVFVRTLYYVARGKREKGAIVRQMYEIGNKSVLFSRSRWAASA